MAKSVSVFESIVCSRCCGSGEYSWNAMTGSRCFKCLGRGWVLTKRGSEANRFFNDLRKVPADSFKVGDMAYFDHYPFFQGFLTLTEVVAEADGQTTLRGVRKNGESVASTCLPSNLVIKGLSGADKAIIRDQALTYQATLTKSGTVSKKAIKVAA